MTQAVNLANFANNLDSSGGLNPSALNAATPISKGGTGSTTAAAARTALGLAIGSDVPSTTGGGASGNWNINITGTSASVSTTNWTVEQSGSNLVFKYNGVAVATISSAGLVSSASISTTGTISAGTSISAGTNITATGVITANGV